MKTIRLYFGKAQKAAVKAVSSVLNFIVVALATFANFCARCVQSPRFAMCILGLLMVNVVLAEGADTYASGVGAINDVTAGIKKYIPVVTKLCYALAGVVAIIGAISIYVAMNNEEQDVKKKIMMTVGACIFLIAAAQALPLFFGISNADAAVSK